MMTTMPRFFTIPHSKQPLAQEALMDGLAVHINATVDLKP